MSHTCAGKKCQAGERERERERERESECTFFLRLFRLKLLCNKAYFLNSTRLLAAAPVSPRGGVFAEILPTEGIETIV